MSFPYRPKRLTPRQIREGSERMQAEMLEIMRRDYILLYGENPPPRPLNPHRNRRKRVYSSRTSR